METKYTYISLLPYMQGVSPVYNCLSYSMISEVVLFLSKVMVHIREFEGKELRSIDHHLIEPFFPPFQSALRLKKSTGQFYN